MNDNPSAQKTNGNAEEARSDVSVKHCFREETGSGEFVDVLELAIEETGDRATGYYNWLPARKSQRTGEFRGSIRENIVSADYEYIQEGTSGTETIEIVLEETQAVVRGGPISLGLNAEVPRINC
ncbi:MAG: hypothetical protein SWY16_11870 [Cyanobacteriota bacterium]|nr:hypothetical protein [Cyanobacteriota bacterium]